MTKNNIINLLAEPEFRLAMQLFFSKRLRFLDVVQLLQESFPERQFAQLKVAVWSEISLKYPETYFYLDVDLEHFIEELKDIGFYVINRTHDESSYIVSLSDVPQYHICNNDEYIY